ncbi:hypothetical protein EIN_292280 [Entamoeba invadens IP1]|uniref:Leucine rich repeat containing protein BspA family protein n=1 Tax=Entamoeba invadens IP1 TaxID=370355 RepID=A0A0A1UFY7_ENTIV|nr:hypothetical protein EIN_292280 [Entamoeba invadens IP1]ELP92049.1 hypothetical protein EIN_292280 [Entamoeba invadens IP1]|eukprot:XP_004258820.1 hypothetical protein EIN_292280 [Entamoeba invadens IP1]
MRGLSGYHIMIVSKYFDDFGNFINLELVCKKFGGNMEKFHFNPIPLNSKTLGYFPNIETLHLWNKKDENFGNEFMINRRENGDMENKNVLKNKFYRIIVWFSVNFVIVDRNKNRNIEFKNVTYTQIDRKKFGNNIPSSVTSIGDKCFSFCGSLTSVTIPSSVSSIGEGCFSGCSNLGSVTIPSSVTSIGYCCFSGCSSLRSITIPSSVRSIGGSCFCKCSSLSSITIPSSIRSIGGYCFYECSSLIVITIPSSVRLINDWCFSGCSSLSSVTIPSSVTSIGYRCFYRCSSLSSYTWRLLKPAPLPHPLPGNRDYLNVRLCKMVSIYHVIK